MKKLFQTLLLGFVLGLSGCVHTEAIKEDEKNIIEEKSIEKEQVEIETYETEEESETYLLDDIPVYSDSPIVEINGNVPEFETYEREEASTSYETYSPLDKFGRCGEAMASIGQDLMPTEDRESLSDVSPSGWDNEEYACVDGSWIYNRSHLIGFQLSGEQANELNLITGTRYMNVEGMLPYENQVADYVKSTGNHVLYRVTPVYDGDDLVASGVQMEAYSIEDQGEGVKFNVYCYNVQPGITIDYSDGSSEGSKTCTLKNGLTTSSQSNNNSSIDQKPELVFISRTGSKYHKDSTCSKMKNPVSISIAEAQEKGYTSCSKCYS